MQAQASYLVASGDVGASLGRKYGVVPDIHVADSIFADLNRVDGQEFDAALDGYFGNGRASAEQIRDIIAEAQGATVDGEKVVDAMSVLDFAAGYGCVARHIRNVIPQGKLVALDTHQNAMYFNTAHLGLQAAVVAADASRVDPFFQFDVVYALEFMSRQPRARIGPWLDTLARFVKVGGILLFTAHGTTTHRGYFSHLQPESDGYVFEAASEPMDFSSDITGTAITYPKFMFREIERLPGVEVVMFRSGAWWNHQDIYVLRRVA